MQRYLQALGLLGLASFLALAGLLVLSYSLMVTPARPSVSTPTPPERNLIDQLRAGAAGEVRISYHAGTGKVRFIGAAPESPILRPNSLKADSTPEQAARLFLSAYGPLFGLADQAQELLTLGSKTADSQRVFLRFQQTYRNIPVLGGELIVQVDGRNNVISAGGEILPDLQIEPAPKIGSELARQRALQLVAKDYGLDVASLTATEPALWVYSPILLGARGPSTSVLVWRTEVRLIGPSHVRELVLVDARLGAIVLHFNQTDAARSRLTYDALSSSSLPGALRRSEGQGTIGDADVDNAHDFAGDAYDFYYTTHGRDSIDNRGMAIVSSVDYCPDYGDCPFLNAFWDGEQIVYGDGFASADDVVGHELTHGVTQVESRLFYYRQSGAINEAFSDIWGELVDLTNGKGNDSAAVRWLIGEDLSIGAIRSMSNPLLFGQPDRMTSIYYACDGYDQGGVHRNNGVANKTAYLMVDGGTFNGRTVAALGITKTAKIWYEVQTNLLTSAADYQDLSDALPQAAINLAASGITTAADVRQVRNAVNATEMNQQPAQCPAPEAPFGTIGQTPFNLFFDDFENPRSGKWITGTIQGENAWYYPQTANPYGFDATYATSGQFNLWGYNQFSPADYYIAMARDVSLPSSATAYLHFRHAYAFEYDIYAEYDGGIVEYSTDGGLSWTDAVALFTHNSYNGVIYNGPDASNPLKGRAAYVGESNGYISSRLSLASLAGQNVRFRFRIGTDSIMDALGWFIDDVRIYTFAPAELPTRLYLPIVMQGYASAW